MRCGEAFDGAFVWCSEGDGIDLIQRNPSLAVTRRGWRAGGVNAERDAMIGEWIIEGEE